MKIETKSLKSDPKEPKKAAPLRRTALGVWAVSQVALELSKNEGGHANIELFEKNLPRVLNALIETEDQILKHYGSVANGEED